ncbi:MAG: SCO family protein [Planctomycetota bacterium]|jgi:protein SCO1/2
MRHLLLVSLLALFVACDQQQGGDKQVSLRGTLTVPEFSFQEAFGKTVNKQTLLGKVWIGSFIFTGCPTHCPAMAREMKVLQSDIPSDDFRIISVTVDPANDTMEKRQRFLKDYTADRERWLFLGGRREDIIKFAGKDGLAVGLNKEEPLEHSLYFALVDKAGVIRDYYNLRHAGRMAAMRKDIKALLAE